MATVRKPPARRRPSQDGTEAAAPRREYQVTEIGEHLEVHSGVCFGKLIFKGTRVPVRTILHRLGQGWSLEELRKNWPQVSREAIAEAADLAATAIIERWAPGSEDPAFAAPVRIERYVVRDEGPT